MGFRLLPLGVDLGSTRVRIACAESDRSGNVRIRAVVARDIDEESSDPARIIGDMMGELGVRSRRCVVSIGAPDAVLKVVRLPRMSWIERTHAARLEALRFVPWDVEEEPSAIRIHPVAGDDTLWSIGIARQSAIAAKIETLRAASLRVVAVDHDAYALRRALCFADAIVDIGLERCTLHVFSGGSSRSWVARIGGAEITRCIARDLSLDVRTAEKRKRILGVAGAGKSARVSLVSEIAGLVEAARARIAVTRIALCGNGSRLPQLCDELAVATSCAVEMPIPGVFVGDTYPTDVVRAASPDWTLASGLALWKCAV